MNLLAIHWGISPEIFSIGPVHIRWYGLLFALAFVVGYQILFWIFNREEKGQRDLEALTIYMIAGTVIGARLGHCIFYAPGFYFSHPVEILKIWEGGLASHGAAIGIFLSILIYYWRRRERYSLIWLMDRISIVIALAAMFVRLGNFFNSEIIGKPSSLPWAVIFDRVDKIPRHPSQLYEGISYFIIFLFLLFWYKKYGQKATPGFLSGFLLTFLFTARFFIEFLKVNQSPFEAGMAINMGQTLSIPLVLTGIFLLIKSLAWKKSSEKAKSHLSDKAPAE